MNVAKIFIQRPVATTVLILALLIMGGLAYPKLPISELPNVDFPTIVVSASLPGADPETMATSVATPIEKELNTIAGLSSMSSMSSAGSTSITLQFDLNRDIDAATQDVQSALLQVSKRLPSQMPNPPTVRKTNPADLPILYLALTANNILMTKVDDYAENQIAPRLSMIQGVAQVSIYGQQQYAVRVYLNPSAMTSRNLSIDSVATAIQNINTNQPAGTLRTNGAYHLIKVDGQLKNADEFSNAVIASVNGAPVRLKDIGSAVDSVQNDKARSWFNGQPAIILAVERQPGENTVAVVKNILALMPALEKNLPGGAHLNIAYNRALFIESSIKDVQYTLIFAAFLVVVVIFLFLRNFSSTIIAVFSLPVSIIATFGFMYAFGYSLDNLSLMGLVLAVGFVIDDAVVVLENITRYVEKGMDRMSASLKGSEEIGFTVIAMTISLVAVFIPIFFMGGIVGRLFHEFAAVVGIAILISGVVSLTLIPMLCSRFMMHDHTLEQKPSLFERGFESLRQWYEDTLRWSVDHIRLLLLGSFALLIATAFLFYAVSKGFIPSEDTNMLFGSVQAPEGITFQDFITRQQAAASIVLKNPNVETVVSSVGQGAGGAASTNAGRLMVRLKPLENRKATADQVVQQLRHALNNLAGLKIFFVNPPAIRIGGKVSNSSYQYVLQGTNWDSLQTASENFKDQLIKLPGIQDADSDLQMNNPELKIHILRDKAAILGITPAQIENALYSAYGDRQVSSIMTSSGDYDVIMGIDPKYQNSNEDINALYVRSPSSNQLVPLNALVDESVAAGPLTINHYGQMPAITVSFNLAPGYSLGQVTSAIQTLAHRVLPVDVSGSFIGTAQTFQASLSTLPLLLLFTVLVIYMVLAILYEHFGHPLTILTALPFAVFGALLALLVCYQELDIFSFIGLIMLVGLTKKNGIMMVDFAIEAKRTQNISAKEAIIQACCIRFRPIMMTTLAALVATLPIALGIGAGGEARRSLGIAVVGGLLFSQMITLYITPVFYLLMDRLSLAVKERMQRI